MYYKDDTHYFVMTAKKKSLLKKGVIKQVRAACLKDVMQVVLKTLCRRVTRVDVPTHRLSLSPQDYSDAEELLASANVDHEALCLYAHDAAHFSTGGKLPDLQFVQNSAGKPDVAMFDFTCMHRAENASLVRERNGQKLLMGLVGDCLVEVGGWGYMLIPG